MGTWLACSTVTETGVQTSPHQAQCSPDARSKSGRTPRYRWVQMAEWGLAQQAGQHRKARRGPDQRHGERCRAVRGGARGLGPRVLHLSRSPEIGQLPQESTSTLLSFSLGLVYTNAPTVTAVQ